MPPSSLPSARRGRQRAATPEMKPSMSSATEPARRAPQGDLYKFAGHGAPVNGSATLPHGHYGAMTQLGDGNGANAVSAPEWSLASTHQKGSGRRAPGQEPVIPFD